MFYIARTKVFHYSKPKLKKWFGMRQLQNF